MLAQVIKDTKSVKPADLQKGFNAVRASRACPATSASRRRTHITINAEQLTRRQA